VATVSGIVQAVGVSAAIPWHGGSSMLLLLLAGGHATRRLWRNRRRLRDQHDHVERKADITVTTEPQRT